VLDACAVERPAFRAFVSAARAAHRDNAFHNFWHVADVTHAASLLLREGGAAGQLRTEEALALLLAGAHRHKRMSTTAQKERAHTCGNA
jgi:hypothetical protein